jgi:hypothetical protein
MTLKSGDLRSSSSSELCEPCDLVEVITIKISTIAKGRYARCRDKLLPGLSHLTFAPEGGMALTLSV